MPTIEEQVKAIVQSWARMSSEPSSTDTLGALWGNSGVGVPFSDAAITLAAQLDGQLGAHIRSSDLTVTTTVADVVNMLDWPVG